MNSRTYSSKHQRYNLTSVRSGPETELRRTIRLQQIKSLLERLNSEGNSKRKYKKKKKEKEI